MSGGPRIDLTDAPASGNIAFVERELIGFNEARALPYDRRPLCIFVRDDAGRIIGGASGLGGRILAAAEAEAIARGCLWSRLFSYSFQAPGFYEKHGYEVFGILDDYPPGHAQVWLRKRLAGEPWNDPQRNDRPQAL